MFLQAPSRGRALPALLRAGPSSQCRNTVGNCFAVQAEHQEPLPGCGFLQRVWAAPVPAWQLWDRLCAQLGSSGAAFAAAAVEQGWIREQSPVPERNLVLETQSGSLGSWKTSIHWEGQADEQFRVFLRTLFAIVH